MDTKHQDKKAETDADIAMRLQKDEDKKLAEQLESERMAQQLDPWKAAEAEWADAQKKFDDAAGAKVAKELAAKDAFTEKQKQAAIQKDRELAMALSKGGKH